VSDSIEADSGQWLFSSKKKRTSDQLLPHHRINR
jgi:hypothetical protein